MMGLLDPCSMMTVIVLESTMSLMPGTGCHAHFVLLPLCRLRPLLPCASIGHILVNEVALVGVHIAVIVKQGWHVVLRKRSPLHLLVMAWFAFHLEVDDFRACVSVSMGGWLCNLTSLLSSSRKSGVLSVAFANFPPRHVSIVGVFGSSILTSASRSSREKRDSDDEVFTLKTQ